jgi:hypothetical protein
MYDRLTFAGNVDRTRQPNADYFKLLSRPAARRTVSVVFRRWLQWAADVDIEYDRREENTKSSYCRASRVLQIMTFVENDQMSLAL